MLSYFMTIWNTYFTAIWYNLWPFGIACSYTVYFSSFGMFGPRKIWQPCRFLIFAVADSRDNFPPQNLFRILGCGFNPY
jgi:hypothetical protein